VNCDTIKPAYINWQRGPIPKTGEFLVAVSINGAHHEVYLAKWERGHLGAYSFISNGDSFWEDEKIDAWAEIPRHPDDHEARDDG
jgi:hypothetical protein